MSKVVRSVKNVTKGYSTPEIKVRNATSNDPWGPVGSDMAEIAQMTFNDAHTFQQIMDMLDKRLNDKGKNWRHVLKSLKVLDYILHEGSELVVTWARKNIYIIRTLREFQHIDDEGRDVGQNIRVSAKELTSLIMDEERLRMERQDRRSWKSRVTGIEEFGPIGSSGAGSSSIDDSRRTRPATERRNRRQDEEDLEYRLAIEASMNEAEEDAKRRARSSGGDDDADLQKALDLSREEEERRRKELEDANASSLLIDDSTPPAQPTVPQPTGWNQGYQQQGAVDWYGNLLGQQQQQPTGFMGGQPTGMAGYANGFGYQQAAPTGFDPNQQNQFMQPQQTAFGMNNPYAPQQQPQQQQQQQQTNGFGDFGGLQQQQQPQQQQQSTLSPGTNNPWAGTSHTTDSLQPQPTGSNNPFAQPTFARPATAPRLHNPLTALDESSATSAFPTSQPIPTANPFPPPKPSPQPPSGADPHHARLNHLLATGDGQDTFGNVGDLRIPAQHTAPGTFVNSAGAGLQRLNPAQTGGNPFLQSQFTGMPSVQRGMPPAQTGPAFGGGSNPFGRGQGQGNQSGSLIDL